MALWVDQLRLWVEAVISELGYGGIALLMLLEGVFPPVPSEVILPFSGSLVAQGRFSFPVALLASTAGSVGVALIYYAAGRKAGEGQVIRRLIARYGRWLFISVRDWDHALRSFERFCAVLILAGRLVPGLRSLISVPAGISRMPLGEFVLLTTLGTLAWNALLLQAGLMLGENWAQVLAFLDQYETVLGLVIFAVVVWTGVRFWMARRRAAGGVEAEPRVE